MRSVDAIHGEIGQVKSSIEARKARLHDLYCELSAIFFTEKGFVVGQTVEIKGYRSSTQAVVFAFGACEYGSERIECRRKRKDGSLGAVIYIERYSLDNVSVLEEPK